MFNQYYDLEDPKKLPPGALFVDPIDNTHFRVSPKESLDDFTNRIQESRVKKRQPLYFPEHLKQFVVASFVEYSDQKTLSLYFRAKPQLPSFSEILSLAKQMASQRKRGEVSSYEQRQARAKKCSECKLHKAAGRIDKDTMQKVEKLSGLESLQRSALESSLGTCGMCGCNMATKIRFSLDNVIANLSPENMQKLLTAYGASAFKVCWIFEEALEEPSFTEKIKTKLKHAGNVGHSLLQTFLTSKQKDINARIGK